MSDLRDQLRKAGLVSEKDLRRAKHEERVHASEVGRAGLAAERRAEEERLRAEAEAQRQADRARDEDRKRREREAAARQRVAQLLAGGLIRDATAGNRRFFFVTRSGRISFLDVSDLAARRLSMGSAAIVETGGHLRREHCVLIDRAAAELAASHPEMIRFWNRTGVTHATPDGNDRGLAQ